MKFQTYQILSHIIPGYLVYAVLIKQFPTWEINYEALPSLGIAFCLGYLVNALGSILEFFYNAVWGGAPSRNLLKGKGMGRIQLSEWRAIHKQLEMDHQGSMPAKEAKKLDSLFNVAVRSTTTSSNTRLTDFNASYALARSFLTCTLVLSFAGFFQFANHISMAIYAPSAIGLILFTGYRARQRGYYLAKEVLLTYFHQRQGEEKIKRKEKEHKINLYY